MKFFIVDIKPNEIEIWMRAEGEDGLIGDARQIIKPNESFGELSFEDLLRLGEGEHELEEKE